MSGKQRIHELRKVHRIEDEWIETEGGARVKRWFIPLEKGQLRLIV
jgi:hypothetical protein